MTLKINLVIPLYELRPLLFTAGRRPAWGIPSRGILRSFAQVKGHILAHMPELLRYAYIF